MGKNKNRTILPGATREELMILTVSEIVKELLQAHEDGKDVNLNRIKCRISSKYGLSSQPRLVDIIAAVPPQHKKILLPKLKAKPVRTASGIAVVAVMCKPHRCPHIAMTGNICVYCPGGPDSDFEYSTQSYTGYEPTSMRAIRARYNPYLQTRHRVEQLMSLGHSVDKVEFIVMGGTFMSLPDDYRDYFIRNLHDALSGHTSSSVDEAVKYSEKSKSKCIGITIETRKKVDPGACSPTKSPMRTPAPVNKTPAAKNKNLTPRKSFKDSIVEKAGQLKNSPVKSTPVKSTPVKLQPGASPGKVGSATKMMQQRLLEQAQHSKTDDIADKLRRDRMNELASLQNRWQNGMLKEDVQPTSQTDQNKPVAYETKLSESEEEPSKVEDRREAIKAQARAEDTASYTFTNKDQPKSESQPPARPPAPKTGSQQGQSSIYRLISQKRGGNEKPNVTRSESTKRVQFEEGDSFDSTDGEDLVPQRHQHPPIMSTEEETDDMDYTDTQSEGTTTQDEEEYAAQKNEQVFIDDESDSDDVSLSAFVPASVRRQSVLPHRPDEKERQRQGQQQKVREPVAPVPASVRHQSTTNLRRLVQEESSSSLDSESSASSSQSSLGQPPRRHDYTNDSDEGDEQGVSDLLDEAIGAEDDTDDEVVYRHRQPVAAPRHHRHESYAIANDSQPVYSVTSYRNSQNIDWSSEGKKKIVRNRTYSADVVEEDIQMPTSLPRDIESKSIKERIQELHELVSQEQSVIMQTSNALNQCCAANSHFAGSAEQVECHRLLLLSCQKRLAYLTEVQRLKDSGQLDPPGTGPKGSLTISDIRLPLKKDFVTRIGSVQDNTVHYFLILIRNHTQVIVTQMLSTHDPMMRGSLDFPNLIKIHGISGSFKLCMEIYSMSVSKEYSAKDKKRKTPKKALKSTSITGPSPGGPTAVRTTSFTLITTIPITMRHLDKSSFTLERIPYLSPLHGTIYMRLKCLMEQNVEERGFLTMFEDVSGLGAWHRRWCVLTGNKLCWWKYPNDETRKEPIGMMDLKRCITEKIGLIPRDVCARPNTFELATVRQPRRGEPDTLVTKTYNTMTTTRHRLSADTKEERIMWCNKVNRALANIRTWHSDAMRPIKASRKN